MRSLTNKHKLAIKFSISVFLFYVVVSIFFYLVVRFVLVNEMKNSLVEESKEIIRNHLVLNDTRIEFTKDLDGNFLKEELTDHGYSAIFLDSEFKLIRSFGLFEYFGNKEKENLKQIVESIDKSRENPFADTIIWRNNKIYSYFFPVKESGNVLAHGVVGMSMDHVNLLTNNILFVLIGFGTINVIGSLILGYYLADRFLKPIKILSRTVEKIDLDRLDKKLKPYGPPTDEFVVLINKFNEMLARIEGMSAQQKDFVSNASHELKNPLTRAITSIELLQTSDDLDKSELDLVKNDLLEINSLLDNLLILSKLRKENLKKRENVRLKRLLKSIDKDFISELEKRRIELVLDVKDDFSINFPESYLKVILTNLISNAIKYSKKDQDIFLRAYETNDSKIIELNDEGVGMTKKQRQRVFDRFYRGKDTSKLEGHGVGMSLVKQICELYDIGINIKSKKGKGTEVILAFQKV